MKSSKICESVDNLPSLFVVMPVQRHDVAVQIGLQSDNLITQSMSMLRSTSHLSDMMLSAIFLAQFRTISASPQFWIDIGNAFRMFVIALASSSVGTR